MRLCHYRVRAADDYPKRDPSDWKLEGSTDGGKTFGVMLDKQSGFHFKVRYELSDELPVSDHPPVNAVRISVLRLADPAGADCLQLGELKLFYIGEEEVEETAKKRVVNGHVYTPVPNLQTPT